MLHEKDVQLLSSRYGWKARFVRGLSNATTLVLSRREQRHMLSWPVVKHWTRAAFQHYLNTLDSGDDLYQRI